MGAAIYCIAVLFTGGLVKGLVGLGLPQVGVPLLTLAIGLKQSVGLLVLPMIATNLAQSLDRKLFLPVARRFIVLLAIMFCVAIISSRALDVVPERVLAGVIGAAVIIFPTIAYLRPRFRIARAHERWTGAIAGAAGGILGGIAGLPGPPLIIYLACLGLGKEEFVVAVSLMFLTASVGLALGLIGFGTTSPTELALSGAACLPVFAGMWLGAGTRLRMSEQAFARVVLVAYWCTGTAFLVKALAVM
jgi:uncharacterized membrane protein YfcA